LADTLHYHAAGWIQTICLSAALFILTLEKKTYWNQSVWYAHSCLELAILMKVSNIHHSQNSVVLESSVKPSWFGLTEDSRTPDLGQHFCSEISD